MAAHGGAADSYYSNAGAQPPMSYPPQAYGNGAYQGQPQNQAPPEAKYQQQPPNYGQNYQNGGAPVGPSGDGKQTFSQAFKIDKPKWNDLWAGILVRVVSRSRLYTSSDTLCISLSWCSAASLLYRVFRSTATHPTRASTAAASTAARTTSPSTRTPLCSSSSSSASPLLFHGCTSPWHVPSQSSSSGSRVS